MTKDQFNNCFQIENDKFLVSTKFNFYVIDKKLKLIKWLEVSKLNADGNIWEITVITLDVNEEGFLIACGLTHRNDENEQEQVF